MLNNLTIVIYTFKRYSFLKRQLDFYLSYKSQAKILILDSTPYDPEDNELEFLLSNENVKWKKYDENTFFPDKISMGCQYIDTDYAVLSSDDDFLIPTSLELCVDFLKKNSEYSSAQGLNFFHRIGQGFIKFFWLTPITTEKALSSEDKKSSKRVINYLDGHSPYYPMYAVHSTNIFRLIWKETAKHVKSQGLPELFSSCMSFIYGKMKVLPVFYCSREPNNYISWNNKEALKEVYSENKITMAVNGLIPHLVLLDQIEHEDAMNQLQSSFKEYVRKSLNKIDGQLLRNSQLFLPYYSNIRAKIRIRSRFNNMFNQGCPKSIYINNFEDFKKVKKITISYGLGFDELNEARKRINYSFQTSQQGDTK